MIVCRSSTKMDEDLKKSLGMYCQVPQQAIINVWDISNVPPQATCLLLAIPASFLRDCLCG